MDSKNIAVMQSSLSRAVKSTTWQNLVFLLFIAALLGCQQNSTQTSQTEDDTRRTSQTQDDSMRASLKEEASDTEQKAERSATNTSDKNGQQAQNTEQNAAKNTAAGSLLALGDKVFHGNGACASCHGLDGRGDGPAGQVLHPKPTNFVQVNYSIDTNDDGKKGTFEDIFNVITNGAAKYGGSQLMVKRDDLAEKERKALTEYVLSLKK